MSSKVTGVILAGGKSSRMGEDKSFLLFSGRPLIETMIDRLSHLFKDLLIVTNSPHLYQRYGIETKTDILKGRGPLGGIYTGLASSHSIYNFIVACDMPFLNQDLVKFMLGKIKGYDLIVPECKGELEPLCAVYSKNCIKPIENELAKDNLEIRNFFKYVKVKIITEKETAKFDPDGLSFINLNTPENHRGALKHARS